MKAELRRTHDPEAQRILGMLASACEEVAEMLERAGFLSVVRTRDLAGIERIVSGRVPC